DGFLDERLFITRRGDEDVWQVRVAMSHSGPALHDHQSPVAGRPEITKHPADQKPEDEARWDMGLLQIIPWRGCHGVHVLRLRLDQPPLEAWDADARRV